MGAVDGEQKLEEEDDCAGMMHNPGKLVEGYSAQVYVNWNR